MTDKETSSTGERNVVLLVEDEEMLLEAITDKLKRGGLEVVTARTYEEAKDQLHNLEQVDAIWLDHYLLGQGTGLDLVTEMKKDKATKNIPVFVVSNTATQDKKETYLQLGVVDYYVKADFRLTGIVEDIKKHLGVK